MLRSWCGHGGRLGFLRPRLRTARAGRSASPDARPLARVGMCLLASVGASWIAFQPLRRRGRDRPPTIEEPRGADPGGPPPSGPVPAPSLPSQEIHRLITDGDHGSEATIAPIPGPALPDFSQAVILLRARRTTTSSPTTVPTFLPARAGAPVDLDDPREGSRTATGADRLDRVADEPGGSGRPPREGWSLRQPFPPPIALTTTP
jgi:hypothetical protein